MKYEILLNDSTFFSGDIIGSIIILVIILAFVALIVQFLWRKIRSGLNENEVLKYEFITIIAHKFRTPLTSMKWLTESQITEETDTRKKETLTEMKNLTEHLISLTGSLIEMTDTDNESKSSYSFETASVCDLVKSVAESNKNIFHEKNIFFSVKCEGPDVISSIDRPRMEFVLQTLFENARAYTPPGRNVEVTVGTFEGKAVVAVVDHGIGIAPTDISRIFTKFYRTKNAQEVDTEGFGVGLFLAQEIVRRHKGKINVLSEGIGKGSTFSITLPIVQK